MNSSQYPCLLAAHSFCWTGRPHTPPFPKILFVQSRYNSYWRAAIPRLWDIQPGSIFLSPRYGVISHAAISGLIRFQGQWFWTLSRDECGIHNLFCSWRFFRLPRPSRAFRPYISYWLTQWFVLILNYRMPSWTPDIRHCARVIPSLILNNKDFPDKKYFSTGSCLRQLSYHPLNAEMMETGLRLCLRRLAIPESRHFAPHRNTDAPWET
jgi:hypothetical protein